MSDRLVHVEMHESVAVVRLDRPPANAIDIAFAAELEQAVAEVEGRDAVRAMVLTGTGACFSAGLDLKLIPSYGEADQRRMVTGFNRLVSRLYGLSRPVIAALNGHTVAGGLVLALTCDYCVATSGPCTFGLTEARVGIPFPLAAITVAKAELTPAAARELVLLGLKSDPAGMLSQGVVDEVKPADQVLARALEVARDASRMPAGAYARIKRQLRGAALERMRQVIANDSDPALEGWLTPETAAAAARILSGKSAGEDDVGRG
jgi:enoyl-CoA hydratase